ncbi:MBL fold metallo-hydrolase [Haploplasma modicum]|uniref:MBL fold metallo-hydrolase n=1 Tax=Haploplasma modicum TaxID=2150 RepID=UPI00068D3FB2|nr:MBL fold metallo-hydrolase [Haploplasma modicum]
MKIVKQVLANEYMSSNAYILIKDNKCVVIDPGFNDNKLYNYLEEHKLVLDKIILTHGHYDHWTGLEELLKRNPNVLVYASSLDHYFYHNNPFTKYLPKIDVDLNDKLEIDILGTTFKIIKTPGHSLGSISLYANDILFSGDLLFYESVGRTDLYGGSFRELELSVKNIYNLPLNTIVYSGHGRPTTIKHEITNNPFIKK